MASAFDSAMEDIQGQLEQGEHSTLNADRVGEFLLRLQAAHEEDIRDIWEGRARPKKSITTNPPQFGGAIIMIDDEEPYGK